MIEQKYQILIAEDAPIQGKKLTYVLEKLGYEVYWYMDGAQAFNALDKHNISLIISDYQMPESDGIDFLKNVRSSEKHKNIPFILLTTVEEENVLYESLERGANEFLNKPFNSIELKLRAQNLISLYQYQKLINDDNKQLTAQIQLQNEILKKRLDDLNQAHIELKDLQEKLIINSKINSLTVMSSGMAHEINNPLTIIKHCSKKMSTFLENEKVDILKLKGLSGSIDKHVDRIQKIVKHLNEFSGNGKAVEEQDSEEINLGATILNLKDFYGGLIEKHQIHLDIKTEDNIIISTNKIYVEQIIMNIIHNAIDAVQTTKNPALAICLVNSDIGPIVTIEDNGPGIPAEIQDKVFDPFFTTKDIGKGTGLGLSLVMAYLKKINANIELKSEPGKTIFKIIFAK